MACPIARQLPVLSNCISVIGTPEFAAFERNAAEKLQVCALRCKWKEWKSGLVIAEPVTESATRKVAPNASHPFKLSAEMP
jgi:hypothetical protein